MSCPSIWKPRCGGGFSLVELLVVIVVISLLSIILAVALPSLLSARGIHKGSSSVENVIRQARETSLNSSRRTAVVIRSTGSRPYARLAVYRSTTNLTANWEQSSPWTDLPEGIVLDNVYAPTNAMDLVTASAAMAGPTGVMDTGTALASNEVLQIVFGANGLLQAANNIELRILRGTYSNGTLAITGENPPKNWRKLVLITPFGRVKEIVPED